MRRWHNHGNVMKRNGMFAVLFGRSGFGEMELCKVCGLLDFAR